MFDLNTYVSMKDVFDALPHALAMKKHDGSVLFVNRAYETLFGVDRREIIGKKIPDLTYLSEEEKALFLARDAQVMRTGRSVNKLLNLERNGVQQHLLYWTGCLKQKDGNHGLLGIIVNITAQKKIEDSLRSRYLSSRQENRRLEDRTNRDFLTELYNRAYLQRSAESLVREAEGRQSTFSCLMIDVDKFKQVNDTHGHLSGDAVLRHVAAILRGSCRSCDITGRYGGDEFMVLMPGADEARAAALASRLCAEMRAGSGRSQAGTAPSASVSHNTSPGTWRKILSIKPTQRYSKPNSRAETGFARQSASREEDILDETVVTPANYSGLGHIGCWRGRDRLRTGSKGVLLSRSRRRCFVISGTGRVRLRHRPAGPCPAACPSGLGGMPEQGGRAAASEN